MVDEGRGGNRLSPAEIQERKNACGRRRYAEDAEFRERMREKARAYYRAHPAPYKERAARRRSLRLERDERPAVRHLYRLRDLASEILGVKCVVAHRVSLANGGAHRLANLALATYRANARMGRRNEADLPTDWRTYATVELPDIDGEIVAVQVLTHPLDRLEKP